jgi:hypothetical protein
LSGSFAVRYGDAPPADWCIMRHSVFSRFREDQRGFPSYQATSFIPDQCVIDQTITWTRGQAPASRPSTWRCCLPMPRPRREPNQTTACNWTSRTVIPKVSAQVLSSATFMLNRHAAPYLVDPTSNKKTYNTRDSLVVTDPTTDLAHKSLCFGRRGVKV